MKSIKKIGPKGQMKQHMKAGNDFRGKEDNKDDGEATSNSENESMKTG